MDKDIIKCNINHHLLKQLCNWKYEGKYSVYNPPSYQSLVERKATITDQAQSYKYICYIKDNNLEAYSSITTRNETVYIGLGLNPQICGQKKGLEYLKDVIEEAQKRYPSCEIKAEIKAWNKRSIKVSEKAGFVITKQFRAGIMGEGTEDYVELVYKK